MNEDTRKVQRINPQAVVLILLILGAVGIIYLLQTKNSVVAPPAKPMLAKGVLAPVFTLPNLKGEKVTLSDYKGKLVLLNIWATWCPPCVEEMPSMEKLHQALKDEGLEILAVSIDVKGAEAVSPFMKQHKLSFAALIDTAGTVKNLYRTTGVPESFIINKDGTIEEIIIGPRDWASPQAMGYFRKLMQQN